MSAQAITQNLSLQASAVAAALDGCLNETIAALEARAAAEATTDGALSLVLDEIARDEQRHAELAWEYVAWAVASGGPPVREALATATEAAMTKLEASAAPEAGAPPSGWGLLAPAARNELRRRACREVLRPAFSQLI